MSLHDIVDIAIPLAGGLVLLCGRRNRYGGRPPAWACNVLALAGFLSIVYGALGFAPEICMGGVPYVRQCRAFLGGLATGCIVVLIMAGEMTRIGRRKVNSADQQLMDESITIASRIIAGEIDPNEGCAEIGKINDKLGWPDDLLALGQLAHEQTGHEHLGMTAENCRPDILAESRKLMEKHSQPHADG